MTSILKRLVYDLRHMGNCIDAATQIAKGGFMNILKDQQGKVGWILLWALGVPIPLLFIFFLMRGCT
jgi:hypothetical protein